MGKGKLVVCKVFGTLLKANNGIQTISERESIPHAYIPLRQDRLLRLLGLPRISARELEQQICLASNHPGATAPALDSLLHAVIPAKYVDQIGATKK